MPRRKNKSGSAKPPAKQRVYDEEVYMAPLVRHGAGVCVHRVDLSTRPPPRPCPGCEAPTTRLFVLLRPPEGPDETRCCMSCTQKFLAAGWKVMRQYSHPAYPLGCCHCGGTDNDFRALSRSGEVMELTRCADCYLVLRKLNWRAAVTFGW